MTTWLPTSPREGGPSFPPSGTNPPIRRTGHGPGNLTLPRHPRPPGRRQRCRQGRRCRDSARQRFGNGTATWLPAPQPVDLSPVGWRFTPPPHLRTTPPSGAQVTARAVSPGPCIVDPLAEGTPRAPPPLPRRASDLAKARRRGSPPPQPVDLSPVGWRFTPPPHPRTSSPIRRIHHGPNVVARPRHRRTARPRSKGRCLGPARQRFGTAMATWLPQQVSAASGLAPPSRTPTAPPAVGWRISPPAPVDKPFHPVNKINEIS
jgi:hypothetical protein